MLPTNETRTLEYSMLAMLTHDKQPRTCGRAGQDIPERPFLPAVMIIWLAVAASYHGILQAEFVFDDYELIVVSERIHKMWHPVEALRTSYWEGVQQSTLYRPLPILSLGVEYRLWGIHYPAGYHALSLVLHGLVCTAVFLFLSLLFGDYLSAWLAALIFAVHPIHTEAVANICFARTELYAALFMFAALCLHLKRLKMDEEHAKRPKEYPGKKSLLRQELAEVFSIRTLLAGLALVSAMLAMLSKESALMLPVLVALSGFFLLQRLDGKRGTARNAWRAVRQALPFLAPAVIYLAMRLIVTGMLGETMQPLGYMKLRERIAVSALVFAEYIVSLFFPVNQSAMPAYNSLPRLARELLEPGKLMVLPLVLLLVAGILTVKRARIFSFAVLWFFVALVPASNIVPIGTVKAERLLYVPSLAAALLFSALCSCVMACRGRMRRYGGWAGFGLVCVLYLTMTIHRSETWITGAAFYSDLIEKEPKSHLGHVGTGNLYSLAGDHQKAIQHLSRGVFIAPHIGGLYFNRALSYATLGRREEAVWDFRKALALEPDMLDAQRGLVHVLQEMKRYDESIAESTHLLYFPRALKGEAFRKRGVAHLMKKEYEWARADFLCAVERAPDSWEAYYGLAEVAAMLGDAESARGYCDILRQRGIEPPHSVVEFLETRKE